MSQKLIHRLWKQITKQNFFSPKRSYNLHA